MGQLVFQATLGGQVNLVGPNTASTFNINVPAVAGNMVTTGDTGTVTNTMLASSAYTAPGTIGSGTPNTGSFTSLAYSTTLTGGTGIVNLGSGQFYKDASGNVGINNASPTQKLSVSGNQIINLGYKLYFAGAANTNVCSIKAPDDTGSLAFLPNDVEAMRIDSSGRLLVGTTSSTNGGNMFVYNPGPSAWSTAVVNSKTDNSTVTNGFLVKYTGVSPSDGNYMFLCQDSNGTNRFYVTNAGGTGGTSDENLKKNIETTRDGYLEDLNKIRIVKYNWKEQPDGTPKDLGWIAQEVEQVFPRMVKTDEDTGIKSVTHSAFVPMLIKAIQEQQAIITQLQADVVALKGN